MPAPRGLVQRLDQGLHRSGLLPRRAKLLVAVSGGADSVALLRLVEAINRSDYWHWTLVVGHVDHGIRGRESAADARFVRRLAEQCGVDFVQRTFKLGARASEDAARIVRIGALTTMQRVKKCGAVVMAHHADDQAETVLLKLLRGCGLRGLGGMTAESAIGLLRIYRPLLGVRRTELREYLEAIGQTWREDATNVADRYLRNRVRAELLPVMEDLAPGVVDAIGRTSALARGAVVVIDRDAAALIAAALIKKNKSAVHFRRGPLRCADWILCGEALRFAAGCLGASSEIADFERIGEAVRLVRASAGGKSVQIGAGLQMRIVRQEVIVERGGKSPR